MLAKWPSITMLMEVERFTGEKIEKKVGVDNIVE